MSKRRILSGTLGVVAASCFAAPAWGSLVTWEFGGEITRVVDNQDFFAGAVDVGTPFLVRYTFESDTPDAEPGDPTRGVYAAVTDVFGHIETLPFGIADVPGRIGVRLQSPANASQAYGLSASVQILDAEAELYMTLRDTSATALSSDALPILPLDLGAFDTAVFTLDPIGKGIVAEGTVTSLVPEPTTLVLLGLGSFASIGIGRKRTGQAVHRSRRRTLSLPTLGIVVGVVGAWCSGEPAHASPVTWEFGGHVTDVTDVAGVLPDNITVGTPFVGSYTFESVTLDTQPANPLSGVYPAIVDYSVQVGGISFLGPVGSRSIVVRLASPSLPTQGYGAGVGVEWNGFLAGAGISLTAETAVVFANDTLPTETPPLELFDRATLSLDATDKLFYVDGMVTRLVPEPGTLVLLGLASFASIGIVRKRTGQALRRSRRRTLSLPILSILVGVAGAWCFGEPASASLVTWEFGGHLTDVTDVAGVLPDSITVGTPFLGSYTFESETADTLPGDPSEGVYPAVTGIQVELDGIVFTGPIGSGSIGVGLGSAVFPPQTYETTIGVEWDGLLAGMGITLRTEATVVFASDALPLEPPPLEVFSTAAFRLYAHDKLFYIDGVVTSLVPEPGTLVILGVGLVALPCILRWREGRALRRGRGRTVSLRTLGIVVGVAGTWCFGEPASASLVTWEFGGYLTDVTDVAGVLPDNITMGTPFLGSYTFESETADTLPGDPSEGVYPAVTDIQLELDGIVFTGPIGPRSIGIGLEAIPKPL